MRLDQARSHAPKLLAPALVVAALAFHGRPVAAQESVMIDGVRPELHVGLGWEGELGFGARVDIPIVPRGFIDDLHDELALSPGGELYFEGGGDGDIAIAGVFAAQWNLYLDPEWSVFPELGLALIFSDRDRGRNDDDEDADLRLRPLLAAGGRYHWSRRNAIVMRLSWPFGLQVGITF
jgi:hypothetical protein